LSGRFTGPTLGLAFSSVVERNEFDVWVDGRSRLVHLNADSPRGIRLDGLGEGDHRLEIVKRSEGLFGSAVLDHLALAPGGRWLDAPARPRWRLEIYGDSITAGACNEDLATDQYDHLARHDPQVGYAAVAARRLGAELVNLAVSGTGLTCSWNPILLADVFDRTSPDPSAPAVAADRQPHVVVVNLGQNDYGFPNSQGRPMSPDYGDRLVALVRALRSRYPGTFIVGALGGMTAVQESEDLRRQWAQAWSTFDDPRVRSFVFQAATANHPRVDVHALLAEELTAFLAQEVLPHLETSPD
jgi:lysophospholipase L1-like esterase